jgi:hypothetical protein
MGEKMFIVNLRYPGTWLELADRKTAHMVERYLYFMETTLTDLAITLTMFCECKLVHQNKEIPESYKQRFPFIHAHSFSYAADRFTKLLFVVAQETGLDHVKQLQTELGDKFPHLRKIVNSVRHVEERISRRSDTEKKKMNLKPIDNEALKAPHGALMIDVLRNNKFGYTIDDGSYQEFEISQSTFEYMVNIFQRLINGFQWKGPARPAMCSY